MRIDIFTIFPRMFESPFEESIIKRARERGLVDIRVHDIREHGMGKHRSVDDTPYGGGAGMVMNAPPIFEAVETALGDEMSSARKILMTPSGEPFSQDMADSFAELPHLAIVCGRYEGVDQRVIDHLIDDEVSIGDYVLSGGEIPATVIVDAVTRLIPGVIEARSLEEESHSAGLLEYPHYTRPATYRGWLIPDVLLSGHHAKIDEWRREKAEEKTRKVRPDLLQSDCLDDDSD